MAVKKFCVLCCISISTWAQNPTQASPYFKSYNDQIILSTYLIDTSNSFEIIDQSSGTPVRLNLNPNRRTQLGAQLSYRFVDISGGISPKFFEVNKDNSGSKFFSINTRLYVQKWMQSFLYIYQRGFYVSYTDREIGFPELASTKIGGSTSYVFNDKFSIRTLANQKQWQTKSAGSFIPSISFYYTNLDLNDDSNNPHSDIYTLSLAPSYYHNLAISQRFLIGLGLAAGAGLTWIDRDCYPLYEFSSNLKIGYNTDRFFTYLTGNSINFIQNEQANVRLNDQVSTVKFALGYRFDPPEKLKTFFDHLNKK
ncbi:DUF4421 family protein [Flavobacterium sp. CYK-55]|nr:DUF4421 family protein [Flavobacterium sp. CYK-55]